MNLNNINATTSAKYGFKVFDWDNNRGGHDGAGRCLVAKVQLKDPTIPEYEPTQEEKDRINSIVNKVVSALAAMPRTTEGPAPQRNEAPSKPTFYQWSGKDSTEEMARKLSIIFNDYREVSIDGKKFQATSIHVKGSITSDPFLFIMGNKV